MTVNKNMAIKLSVYKHFVWTNPDSFEMLPTIAWILNAIKVYFKIITGFLMSQFSVDKFLAYNEYTE